MRQAGDPRTVVPDRNCAWALSHSQNAETDNKGLRVELTCSNFKAGDFKNNLLFIDKLVEAGLELSLELRGHFLVRGTQERKWSDATTPLRGLL